MKRIILSTLLLFTATLAVHPQNAKPSATVTDEQWMKLLVAINDEQWDSSFNLASEYMKKLDKDDERLPKLRYIYLYAAAGEILKGKLSKDKLGEGLKEFIGAKIVMPPREIALDCDRSFNYICPAKGREDVLVTTASDKTATHILAFEYIKLQEKFDVSPHEGEMASVGGIIQSIQLSPEGAVIWAMRIVVEKGFITIREQSKPSVRLGKPSKTSAR
ncbi:MAG TPA: hypothetical protein VM095_18230 [Pyrinomonadaceae bacterium]|nr:hypothetical protein [Pyrinomonadaceae bacterium]